MGIDTQQGGVDRTPASPHIQAIQGVQILAGRRLEHCLLHIETDQDEWLFPARKCTGSSSSPQRASTLRPHLLPLLHHGHFLAEVDGNLPGVYGQPLSLFNREVFD